MQPDWTVLLLGGSSATGKSYLARQLAAHYQIPLTEIDDIRIAIQQIAEKEKHPDLFYFLDQPNAVQVNDTSYLVDKLVKVAQEIWPALDELITKHIVCHEPVIFEGDGIIPELLAHRDLKQVKSLFLVDTRENLYTTTIQRQRGNFSAEAAHQQAVFSFQYGVELEKQAVRNHFPVIKTSPRETLYERVRMVLDR